ncbi:lipopolysaccharide biosynthesis, partial [Pseudotabrizicola sediminis]
EQKAESVAELEKVNDSIRRSAANGVQLASLEREYANLQIQYNSAVNNMAQASTGERIEVLSRGGRVSL